MFVCSTSSNCLDGGFDPIVFTGSTEKEVLSDVFNYWYDELLNYQDMDPETSEQFNEFSQLAEDVELNRYKLKMLLANLGIGFSMVKV